MSVQNTTDNSIGEDKAALEVIDKSGQPVSGCFHCQRCGGGCPVAESAGTTPDRFLRKLRVEGMKAAMESPFLWLCVGCGTCGTRCPNDISTNEVIDPLRAVADKQRKISSEVAAVRTFHRLMLKEVKKHGRLHEGSLIFALKLRTRKFFKDMFLGMKMFRKGKIPLLPYKLFGVRGVKALFKRRGR